MKIQINPNTYNDILTKLYSSKKRIVLNMGGAGSGKSVSAAQCFLLFALERQTKLLVVRKVGSSLTDSVVAEFKKQADLWNIKYKCVGHGSATRMTILLTGTVILFKGLDDVNKLKSISGIEKVLLEEATGDKYGRGEITEEDFNQLNTRVRGKNLIHPQLFLVFNPVSEESWIHKRFFVEKKERNIEIYTSTYKDNKFLDDAYKNVLENYKYTDYNHYRIYCLGEWGVIQTGKEIYRFKKETLVSESAIYNPLEPLHLSFDDNAIPYQGVCISQIYGNNIHIIDEVAIKGANLKETCTHIRKKYKDHQHVMFIYGDATAKKRDSKLEKGSNFFTLIMDYLKEFKPMLRLMSCNPSVVMRVNWVNEIFEDYNDIKVLVNPNCKVTITDFECVKQNPQGAKLKERGHDESGSFEKWGHLSDCFEYLLCKAFDKEYNKFLNGGKEPIRRMQVRDLNRNYV